MVISAAGMLVPVALPVCSPHLGTLFYNIYIYICVCVCQYLIALYIDAIRVASVCVWREEENNISGRPVSREVPVWGKIIISVKIWPLNCSHV